MQQIVLPKLETIGEKYDGPATSGFRLSVKGTSQLTKLDLPALKAVGVNCSSTCSTDFTDNAKLTSVNLPNLYSLGGDATTDSGK